MKFKSDSCFGRHGEPLNSYEEKPEAAEHARYIRREHGSSMVPYKCERCGYWHLSPVERQTTSSVCAFCRDRTGNSKDLYRTKSDAERRAEINKVEKGITLNVYECPHQKGWHLTKRLYK